MPPLIYLASPYSHDDEAVGTMLEDSSRVYWVGTADAAKLLGLAEEQAKDILRKHETAFATGYGGQPYFPILLVLQVKDKLERDFDKGRYLNADC